MLQWQCMRLLQLKERDNLGNKTRQNLKIQKTSLSQDIFAATHTAPEDDDSLNSLSYNQFVHSGGRYYWRDFLYVECMLFTPATGMNLWTPCVQCYLRQCMLTINTEDGCLTSGQCCYYASEKKVQFTTEMSTMWLESDQFTMPW